MADLIGRRPFRRSRKFPVQVLSILINHTHGPMGKAAYIDKGNDDHRPLYLLRAKLLRKLNSRLDAHIFCAVDSGGDKGRPFPLAADHSHRKLQPTSLHFQIPGLFLPSVYFQCS